MLNPDIYICQRIEQLTNEAKALIVEAVPGLLFSTEKQQHLENSFEAIRKLEEVSQKLNALQAQIFYKPIELPTWTKGE